MFSTYDILLIIQPSFDVCHKKFYRPPNPDTKASTKAIMPFASRNKLFLATVFLITCWCSQRNQGWMIAILAPTTFIYQLGKFGIFWKDGLQRKDRYVAIAFIAISILTVAASHEYHHKRAKTAANKIVTDIVTFRKNYGRYPANEMELGVTTTTRKHLYRLKYKLFAEEPVLSYSGTFGLFRKWEYSFSTGAWIYESE